MYAAVDRLKLLQKESDPHLDFVQDVYFLPGSWVVAMISDVSRALRVASGSSTRAADLPDGVRQRVRRSTGDRCLG
jgi:ABC-type Na+ transport system ATPase subunit NatA